LLLVFVQMPPQSEPPLQGFAQPVQAKLIGRQSALMQVLAQPVENSVLEKQALQEGLQPSPLPLPPPLRAWAGRAVVVVAPGGEKGEVT
jgi:hypothetical protein